MYTPEDCDRLLEKLANMEMGMPPQQAPMSPGSGGLVPGGPQGEGGGGAGGPKGPPKVKPEQLYERMLKMTGRMADMSAQIGQSGQQVPSMEQMVREDQQEMQQASMGMDLMMGGQPGMDPNGMPPQGGPPPGMPPQGGLQPQASLKNCIKDLLEKAAVIGPLMTAQFTGDISGKAFGAVNRMGQRYQVGNMGRYNPLARGTSNMMTRRIGDSVSVPNLGGNFERSDRIGFSGQ